MATPSRFLDGLDGLARATSHPAYAAAVPDWFWDAGDPRAPFGSDDGHDTLRHLEELFFDGGADEDAPAALVALLDDWALVPEDLWDGPTEALVAWLDADEPHVRFLHGEIDAYVAAALAHFKIAGGVHPQLRAWAERACAALETVVGPWEERAYGAQPGRYDERVAAVRTALAAAPALR